MGSAGPRRLPAPDFRACATPSRQSGGPSRATATGTARGSARASRRRSVNQCLERDQYYADERRAERLHDARHRTGARQARGGVAVEADQPDAAPFREVERGVHLDRSGGGQDEEDRREADPEEDGEDVVEDLRDVLARDAVTQLRLGGDDLAVELGEGDREP